MKNYTKNNLLMGFGLLLFTVGFVVLAIDASNMVHTSALVISALGLASIVTGYKVKFKENIL